MKKFSQIFENEGVLHDLKGKSVRAGFSSITIDLISQLVRVGSMIIMARLLLPEHFGLVGMVTALTVFAERLKHLGLSTATIQQKHISHEQVSALFWINASTGVVITVAIMGFSPLIASFYDQPSLVLIAMTMSLGFTFGGLTVQHEALLRRQLKLFDVACVQVIATFLSAIIAIGLALNGFTYWALVWKEVARTGVEMMGMWIACRWWPSLPSFQVDIKPLLRTGSNLIAADTVYFLSRSADQLLLGKFAGASALGLYKQAFQLMALPMGLACQSVEHAALPSLSALQDQPERYQRYYTKILALLSFVSIPLATYLAIFSEEIVHVVLGASWESAAQIFRVLAIAALIEPLYTTYGMVMITQKKTKELAMWTLLHGMSLVIGFAIGIPWGAVGVAVGYTIANYVLVLPSLWFCFKGTSLSITVFFQTIAAAAIISAILAILLLILSHAMGSMHTMPMLVLSSILGAIVYLGLWVVYPSGRRRLLDDASYLFSILKPAASVGR
jgi:PST family polysaccharide transporter